MFVIAFCKLNNIDKIIHIIKNDKRLLNVDLKS